MLLLLLELTPGMGMRHSSLGHSKKHTACVDAMGCKMRESNEITSDCHERLEGGTMNVSRVGPNAWDPSFHGGLHSKQMRGVSCAARSTFA